MARPPAPRPALRRYLLSPDSDHLTSPEKLVLLALLVLIEPEGYLMASPAADGAGSVGLVRLLTGLEPSVCDEALASLHRRGLATVHEHDIVSIDPPRTATDRAESLMQVEQ